VYALIQPPKADFPIGEGKMAEEEPPLPTAGESEEGYSSHMY